MSSFGKQRQVSDRRWVTRSRPALEVLEQRVTLSTFHVNTLLDSVAVNLKTGKDASGHISLRSAIQAANSGSNSDTIIVPSGTITLTLAGANEDNAATGDLDIRNNLTIKGKGAGATIIDGNNLDRVFQIFGGKVSITGVTIEHGRALAGGGGLLNGGGNVTLTNVTLENNLVFGLDGGDGVNGSAGGAIGNGGGSGVNGTDAEGGAIMNASGSLALVNDFISTNMAQAGNGGNGGTGAFAAGANGNPGADGRPGTGGAGGAGGIGGNAFGGGLYNETGARLTLNNSLFFSNTASGGSGGTGGSGNIGAGGAGGNDSGGVGSGGFGTGGAGGAGGAGGVGEGGGLFNLSSVTLSGPATGYNANVAIGGVGGHAGSGDNGAGGLPGTGTVNDVGGAGGGALGGAGGAGGAGGPGLGGGVFNGSGASVSGNAILIFSNTATGNHGGAGGDGGFGNASSGGIGGTTETGGGRGGNGGFATGGNGGVGGPGGFGLGGGMFNSATATFTLKAQKNAKTQPISAFSSNQAGGGGGGDGGIAGSAFAGNGGNGRLQGNGGSGGRATGGNSGDGVGGDSALGGGLYNAGTASFSGVTVNFKQNQVRGGNGGNGGNGRDAKGGNGGSGVAGGAGGVTVGGNGGNGGASGIAEGGGILVDVSGTLVIKPRLGAKKGSKQAQATDTITGNQAFSASFGNPGAAGTVSIGFGGSPHGLNGLIVAGKKGSADTTLVGAGGGIATFGDTTIDDTTISGNTASTGNNDVLGTIKT